MTFKPGVSGNPKGRMKGSGYKQVLFKEFAEIYGYTLLEKAKEMAFEGNERMIVFLLERILPPKPKDIESNVLSHEEALKELE